MRRAAEAYTARGRKGRARLVHHRRETGCEPHRLRIPPYARATP